MGSAKGVPHFLTDHATIRNLDDCYKNLTHAIVFIACQDYIDALVRPASKKDFSSENISRQKTFRKIRDRIREFEAGRLNGTPDNYLRQLTQNQVGKLRKLMPSEEAKERMEELLKCLRLDTYDHKKAIDICNYMIKSFASKQAMLMRKHQNRSTATKKIEEFFHSDEFYAYTDGKIDPDKLIEVLRKEAERRKKNAGSVTRTGADVCRHGGGSSVQKLPKQKGVQGK